MIREERLGQRVWRWELDNPKRRNAVHPDALRWMAHRCRDLAGDLVVLTGAGDKAFCAGFDLTELNVREELRTPDSPLAEATAAMRAADATFIAAVQGVAVGAGVELVSACDIRLAATGIQFWVPAARLGVVYHAEGIQTIRAAFGPALTTRMLLLGHRIEADEALSAGALIKIVEREAMTRETEAMIDDLLRSAPMSLRSNRNLLRTVARGPLDPRTRLEHERARMLAFSSEDHREARRAAKERRDPVFRGR